MKEHGVETAESRVSSDVRDHGWHVVLVGASGSAPEFAYTVGLTATFQHLEIAVLGLPSAKAQLLLNGVGAAIRQGTRFGAGDQSAELLIGYPVAFIAFPPGRRAPNPPRPMTPPRSAPDRRIAQAHHFQCL